MSLSRFAIRRPVAVAVVMLAIVVIGVFGYTELPTNLMPDITYPLVKVYIPWRGATPEEIETDIADPVERQMATVDGLDYLESSCTEGLYQLLVNFKYEVDRDVAYQDVLAKMGIVTKRLPKDIDNPTILKADPSQLSIVDVVVSSDTMDLVSLRTWADNFLQDQFVAVPGTAGTDIVGGQVREIRVHLDPERLQAYRLTVDRVAQRLRDENLELVGGRVTGPQREYLVRTMGRYRSVREIGDVVLSSSPAGGNLYLRDVAQVLDLHQVQRVMIRLNGQEGVKLSTFKQPAANVAEVSDGVRRKIGELLASLPPGVHMDVTYDQGEYVRAAVKGVREAAIIAAVLVVLVTAFFLTGWRRVLTVMLTLPISLLGTFFVMKIAGFSINIFSLGGLVVAITVLLDNCVVVLENITRLQTEHPEVKTPVQTGATEMAGAVTAATLTFLALFLPFLLVSGLTALLFRELVITVGVVLALSLLVALTVTPMLTARFFPEGTPVIERAGPVSRLSQAVMAALIRLYRPALHWSLRRPWVVVGVTAVLFVIGLGLLRGLGSELMPEMEDGLIIAGVRLPTGTPVAVTDQVLQKIEEVVRKDPAVDHVSRLSGGWVWGLVTYEVAERGQVDIQLVPRSRRKMDTPGYVATFEQAIKEAVKVPGARMSVKHAKLRGLRQIGEHDVEVEIYGPRGAPMGEMMELAGGVREQLLDIPGLTGQDVSLEVTKPEYQIVVDRARAAALGVNVSEVASTVRSMVDGVVPTSYLDGGYYYDVRVMMDDQHWKHKENLENILLPSTNGGTVYLRDVARVVPGVGPVQIDRKDQARLIKATADALGRTAGEVNRDAAARVAPMSFPEGYSWRLGGQAAMIGQEYRSLAVALLLALFFAYVVLAIQFESFLQPFLIMIRVPLSLIGVAAGLFVAHVPIGTTAIIGIVILAGIEVNHGVVLLTATNLLRQRGLSPREAIAEAGVLRLRPILMTALVGIVGMIPLALALHEGTELLKPMAVGVMGGLIFSVFLTLLFLPALYLLFAGRPEQTAGEQV
jgi:hydrophobe/amphiphile efflux-1 (HAE1) family protein